jgi:two-component SAPR family response regulator
VTAKAEKRAQWTAVQRNQKPKAAGEQMGAILKDLRIMVMEDEYFIADEIRRELERSGATVIGPVAQLAEAIKLADHPMDAAVLDINISGELAFKVADILEARSVPFVFATGYDKPVLPARYCSVPVCEKPLPTDVIGLEIANVVAARDKRRQVHSSGGTDRVSGS